MKIGILTFWKTEDNYGQLLQCYATQTYLQSLGHDTFLIKATNGRNYNPTIKEQLFSKLRTAYRLFPYPIYLVKRCLSSLCYTLLHGKLKPNTVNRGFENFRKDYLNCTDKEYSLDDLKCNPPYADAYIVGSDQIWNTTDGIFFLSWAPEQVKKIAIAASFGSRSSSPDFAALISPWLKRFDLISVREKSGVDICRQAGIENASLIVDPTLLLRADQYNKIASKSSQREPYIFVYFLGTRTEIRWNEIHSFARSKGLKIKYVGSQGQEDKFSKMEATIEEWLSLMANADYVITNSFHGTIFAMQFHKKFMVYPVKGVVKKMNDRLTTLLNPLGLSGRIYQGNISPLDREIDYKAVFEHLDRDTDIAQNLLAKELESQQLR